MMMRIVTSVGIVLLALCVRASQIDIGCAVWGNKGMYDLRPLAKRYSSPYYSVAAQIITRSRRLR